MTGLMERRGRSAGPDVQRAAQARCSRVHTRAVREGFVKGGMLE
jgi:hypothetical protein